ncbi:MAG: hypothetical protein ACK5S6_02350 [bacterium]
MQGKIATLTPGATSTPQVVCDSLVPSTHSSSSSGNPHSSSSSDNPLASSPSSFVLSTFDACGPHALASGSDAGQGARALLPASSTDSGAARGAGRRRHGTPPAAAATTAATTAASQGGAMMGKTDSSVVPEADKTPGSMVAVADVPAGDGMSAGRVASTTGGAPRVIDEDDKVLVYTYVRVCVCVWLCSSFVWLCNSFVTC